MNSHSVPSRASRTQRIRLLGNPSDVAELKTVKRMPSKRTSPSNVAAQMYPERLWISWLMELTGSPFSTVHDSCTHRADESTGAGARDDWPLALANAMTASIPARRSIRNSLAARRSMVGSCAKLVAVPRPRCSDARTSAR